MSQEYLVVGKRPPRPDAFEKATGSAKYTADIKLQGMLIAKVLRSPYPHAKILKIDTSKAEKVPGVEGVITLTDVPQKAFNSSFSNITTPPRLRGNLYFSLSSRGRKVSTSETELRK